MKLSFTKVGLEELDVGDDHLLNTAPIVEMD